MQKVLVVCTSNSCRSIIAEALINHLGSERYQAVSAGSAAAGHVHPKAIETLQRHGIEAARPRSKSWNAFAGQTFDLVITVCDEAARQNCPVVVGVQGTLHWSTPDPAGFEGTDAQRNRVFDETFELLKKRIESELL
jgi:protein-tyrosine-phosphatase